METANIICPNCGNSNGSQTSYCLRCGNPLFVNQPAIPTVAPQQTMLQQPGTYYGTYPQQSVPSSPMYGQPAPVYNQPFPQQPHPDERRRNIMIASIIGMVVLFFLIVGGAVLIISNSSKLPNTATAITSKPTVAPTYPMLVSSYAGIVHNNSVNQSSSFKLVSVVEDSQGNISGSAFVGHPLLGSGPFKSNVGMDKPVKITITPDDNAGVSSIVLVGTIKADGSMGGTYTIPGTSQTGTWQVSPS